jgi:predicted amidohydrolase
MTPPLRIAIGQLQMHWTIEANMAALQRAIAFAAAQGAQVCCFSELAVTGFHRQIAALAKPALVQPCLEALARSARQHRVAVAVGAPRFTGDGRILNSHVLLDETGAVAAVVDKIGLTAPEATFFAAGSGRPVGRLQGWRCSAVICREVEDLDDVALQLPPGAAQLLFWPGLMSPDPDKPPMDPPEHVQQAQRLARRTGAWVVQANWPNALNYPETSPGTGRSVVIAPDGNILLALPPAAPGVGVFNLGSSTLNWHAEESLTP